MGEPDVLLASSGTFDPHASLGAFIPIAPCFCPSLLPSAFLCASLTAAECVECVERVERGVLTS